MTLPTVQARRPTLTANEFEVRYITEDGTRYRVPLAAAFGSRLWAAVVLFRLRSGPAIALLFGRGTG
jgi:hypothetical protein